MSAITIDDVRTLRNGVSTILRLNLKVYGTREQRARYKNEIPPLSVAVGTQANRARAQALSDLADKIEERLSA